MFEPSKLLQKYLNATPRDMYDIVGALIGYLNADPWFETNDFEEAISYVLSRGVSENDLYSNFSFPILFMIFFIIYHPFILINYNKKELLFQ